LIQKKPPERVVFLNACGEEIIFSLRQERQQEPLRLCSRRREQLRAQQEQQQEREQRRALLLFYRRRPRQQPTQRPESGTFAFFFLKGREVFDIVALHQNGLV
jgi:hypothetical protein